MKSSDAAAYERGLHRILAAYVVGLLGLTAVLAWAEQGGLSRQWLGPIFLFASVVVYAVVGIWGRTTDADEYYVAGRRVPPVYNGMASAADWMSAATFISLAGGLYLQGYSGTPGAPGGLAFVMGWTGGFCLVGLLVAPHLRRHNLYTVPDYFQLRYGGAWPRRLAAVAAILCSFSYVVAQIYGVGLIASRLTGVDFEIGILLGLGGVLLCSFLGGMRAVTWTQVAQYLILLLAFLLPVSWLAWKQLGNPLAPLAVGQQMARIAELERALVDDPAEVRVRALYRERAEELTRWLEDPELALERERHKAQQVLRRLKQEGADSEQIVAASRALAALPADAAEAQRIWTRQRADLLQRSQPLGGMPPHGQPFAATVDAAEDDRSGFQSSRLNFLALLFCLMLGTAGLPHLLTRFFTVPTVGGTRRSVAWALLFVVLLYLGLPALAILVKFEIMQGLVGTSFDALPAWIGQWARVDPALISVVDVNGDRRVQFGEIQLSPDVVMLLTPELGGLPYVVSGLVAAGGLAAALSTADGLLLTISNAMVRDLYAQEGGHHMTSEQRVILSKFALLAVALVAALVAALKPSEILPLVASSFSLAASALVPAMLAGIFWRDATRAGAVAGMLGGLGLALSYMLLNAAPLRSVLGLPAEGLLWFGIAPVSAGVFGVPFGVALLWGVSIAQRRRAGSATST